MEGGGGGGGKLKRYWIINMNEACRINLSPYALIDSIEHYKQTNCINIGAGSTGILQCYML